MGIKLLTPEEAAERLGIKVSTIRRRILERRIDAVKIGRNIRIPEAAVEKLIQEGFRPALPTGRG